MLTFRLGVRVDATLLVDVSVAEEESSPSSSGNWDLRRLEGLRMRGVSTKPICSVFLSKSKRFPGDKPRRVLCYLGVWRKEYRSDMVARWVEGAKRSKEQLNAILQRRSGSGVVQLCNQLYIAAHPVHRVLSSILRKAVSSRKDLFVRGVSTSRRETKLLPFSRVVNTAANQSQELGNTGKYLCLHQVKGLYKHFFCYSITAS
jgi:hypothetical protein